MHTRNVSRIAGIPKFAAAQASTGQQTAQTTKTAPTASDVAAIISSVGTLFSGIGNFGTFIVGPILGKGPWND